MANLSNVPWVMGHVANVPAKPLNQRTLNRTGFRGGLLA
jgi:hypothetical protein